MLHPNLSLVIETELNKIVRIDLNTIVICRASVESTGTTFFWGGERIDAACSFQAIANTTSASSMRGIIDPVFLFQASYH